MGNSSSAPSSRPPGAPTSRLQSPSRTSSPATTSSISNHHHHPHHSLRAKKKSLELPDLASLALTSSHAHPYSGTSRPLTTSSPIPIPIPTSPHVNSSSRGRHQPQFPSTQQMPDVYMPQPSTHIPIPPSRSTRNRGNPHIRGAPLPYSSTRSFASRGNQHHPRNQDSQKRQPPPFIPETVQSTIPIALTKRKNEGVSDDKLVKSGIPGDDSHEPISVKIMWRGAAKSVVLTRAGDDNWKGRLPMEREDPSSNEVWFVYVTLAPGTHHFRFLVDDQWRVADDLPTAVDDEGSLANYVGVALFTPPSSSTNAPTPAPPKLQPGQSFWSTSSSTGDGPTSVSDDRVLGPGPWTSELPPELIAAAKEEENYLVSSSSAGDTASVSGVPAPNIPPAPTLPRFLDKLILNVKPTAIGPAPTRPAEREREDKRPNSRKFKSALGMTGTGTAEANGNADAVGRAECTPARTRLYAPGLADDTSVLPVPSHVVLQHLSTSAIRNGVLAVGNTTRYRKKYLTTIYYKPT